MASHIRNGKVDPLGDGDTGSSGVTDMKILTKLTRLIIFFLGIRRDTHFDGLDGV